MLNFKRLMVGVAAAASLCAMASAEIYTRVALLRGDAEVPAVTTNAKGWAMFKIDTDTNTVSYRIAYAGLSSTETAAHVHGFANPGVNAGVLIALPAGNPKVGSFTYAEVDQDKVLGGMLYVNIHTVNFPGGEIRGQIVSAVAELSGDQEVPANASTATGFALFNMDYCHNELSYYISYAGLGTAETAAHFHGKALPGANAGVIFPLAGGSPKTGIWSYDPALEQAIADGMLYVNIHTVGFPGGEIRGQIVASVNPVDGKQEVPAVTSTAAGGALISFDRTTNTIGYGITHRNIVNQTASHFHGFVPAGSNAGVQFSIGVGTPKRGTWNYGAADAQNVFDELVYFNAHTAANPGGEIRGQIRIPTIFYCLSDVNRDGIVDLGDFFQFFNDFDSTANGADVNCDNVVDLADFFDFLNGFDVSC